MMKLKAILTFSLLFSIFTSCSDYQKIVKGDDYEMKVIEADRMYEKGSYTKALTLLEQIYQRYPNTQQGRKAYYRMAKSYFAIEDYYMAGYYFNQYTQRYPSSDKVEECLFMTAICSVKNSPAPSLDQEETELALNDLQMFVQRYPNSSLVDSCNRTMDRLRLKLETKRFDAVKLYANMENYRAAVASAKSFLEEYPQSKYKTEAAFLEFENAYFLGKRSIFSKKKERLEDATEIYARYSDLFTENELRRKSERYIEDIQLELQYVAEKYAYNEISAAYQSSRSESTQKKVTYLKETLKRYDNFAKQYPESSLLEKAKNIKEKAEKELLNI
tara:strand:- start:46197 stop:47189 length:993 start_codon:yes stop_codon:yes gene_type:complete